MLLIWSETHEVHPVVYAIILVLARVLKVTSRKKRP